MTSSTFFRKLSFLCLAMMLFALFGCAPGGGSKVPVAKQGVLDLSGWNFTKDGNVNLNGEWLFYWQQLLTSQDLPGHKDNHQTVFAIPGTWNGREVAGSKLGGDGYATFRLHVRLPGDSPQLAIRVLDQASAYLLWINGQKVASNGAVGTGSETTRPQYLLQVADIPSGARHLDLVLQVANFNHSKGGAWNPVTLGSSSELQRFQNFRLYFDFFLFGSLVIMGGYHVCLFLLRRKDYSVLYFGLFCLVVALRTALTENRFFTILFPDFSWEMVFKIELLTVHAAFLLLLLFIHSLYRADCSHRLMRILQSVCLVFGLATIVTPARISSLLVEPFHPLILFIHLYIFYILIRAVIRRRGEAAIILFGLLFFFLAVINDILHNHGVIATAYVAPAGFLVLVCFQSFALARRYSLAFTTVARLSAEREENIVDLSNLNLQITTLVSSLQQKVEEHSKTNQELERQIAERSRLERAIVMVGDNERLRISQELHDGLCQQLTGARLRCAVLENRLDAAGISNQEVSSLGQLLDEAVNHAYDLSRGLWPLEQTAHGLTSALEKLIRRMSDQSGIDISFQKKQGCQECSSEHFNQIQRIAREAVTNAVKHSKARRIFVSLECSAEGNIILEVRDDGKGMDINKKANGGMGIGIMKQRARIIGGRLEIRDAEGGGVCVKCLAPCKGNQAQEAYSV
jgi:signal transduction histidine kinase